MFPGKLKSWFLLNGENYSVLQDPLAKKKMNFLFSSLQVRIIFVNSSSIGDAIIITLTNYSATKIVYLQMMIIT